MTELKGEECQGVRGQEQACLFVEQSVTVLLTSVGG